MVNNGPTRREHDLFETCDVPVVAYFGIHTLRTVENLPISGIIEPCINKVTALTSSFTPRRTRTYCLVALSSSPCHFIYAGLNKSTMTALLVGGKSSRTRHVRCGFPPRRALSSST